MELELYAVIVDVLRKQYPYILRTIEGYNSGYIGRLLSGEEDDTLLWRTVRATLSDDDEDVLLEDIATAMITYTI